MQFPIPNLQASPLTPSTLVTVYAEALTLASAFRCSKRRCFFNRMTLNRSKSVRFFRRSARSRVLAQLVSSHFSSILAFSHADLTVPVLAPRGSFSMTKGESRQLDSDTGCRGTVRFSSCGGPAAGAGGRRVNQCHAFQPSAAAREG